MKKLILAELLQEILDERLTAAQVMSVVIEAIETQEDMCAGTKPQIIELRKMAETLKAGLQKEQI